ncbi:MAG: sugar transferase [Bacteroidales bacterium]|jgi:lipopolysaccharide/colanic/teichoic acid biosynthesis glycosyltransferase|nr:sugar transferase [Bacteroidales bacterium]MDY0369068.1 sugar transferase [Bacteroidales bacterium]
MVQVDTLTKNNRKASSLKTSETFSQFRIPWWKRLFDIFFSVIALLIFSPLMLVIALLIKIDSRGPVIYSSRRVGTGYDIFNFYKFRSMHVGAEQELPLLSDLNLYLINRSQRLQHEEEKCPQCQKLGHNCSPLLYIDGTEICENWYFELRRRSATNTTFFKAKGDPRITRIGRIIRSVNLDELPQLFNVIKGDMSIVGNRPLPLYEAEKLTTDLWSYRFIAPAGITGLWQIQKNRFYSQEERIALDNQYAMIASFWMDVKIIFKTLGTFFRKGNY